METKIPLTCLPNIELTTTYQNKVSKENKKKKTSVVVTMAKWATNGRNQRFFKATEDLKMSTEEKSSAQALESEKQ